MAEMPGASVVHEAVRMYRRLQSPTSIRLTELIPRSWVTSLELGLDPDSPQAGMVEADLNDTDLEYIALSYVWGGVTTDRSIRDGRPQMGATENLLLAMSDLSDFIEEPTKFWIDALCIDQLDPDERSSQVRLMYDIYSKANHVMVHVGPAADDSDLVPSILQTLFAAQQAIDKTSTDRGVDSQHIDRWEFANYGLPEYSGLEWDVLNKFFARPWFSRSWTLQEIHAANASASFICGGWDVSVPQWLLSKAIQLIRDINPRCYVDPAVMMRLHAWGSGVSMPATDVPLSAMNLLEILRMNRTDSCSDPRDSVYAYLGVSGEANIKILAPDYRLSTASVFHNYAEFLVQNGHGLSMLDDCFAENRDPFLPSWVPRWDSPNFQRAAHDRLLSDTQTDLSSALRVSEERPYVLLAKGIIVDEIALVGEPRPPNTVGSKHITILHPQTMAAFEELGTLASRGKVPSPPYEDFDRARWRILAETPEAAPQARVLHRALADRDFFAFYTTCLPHLEIRDGLHCIPPAIKEPFEARFGALFSLALDFAVDICQTCAARRACVTERGFLGNVDPLARPGDKVVLLKGAAHPFVMRTVDMGEATLKYILIGHAYFEGLPKEHAGRDDVQFEELEIA